MSAPAFAPYDRAGSRRHTFAPVSTERADHVATDEPLSPTTDGRVSVRVVVRCRPGAPNAGVLGFSNESGIGGKILLKVNVPDTYQDKDGRLAKGTKEFKCNAFLNPGSSQEDVFVQAVPIVDRTMQGYNGTIFCYGVTGSGKTHTISGPPSEIGRERSAGEDGVAQRVARHLFEYIASRTSQGEVFIVEASYLEVYSGDGKREQLIDLLADSDKTKLEVKRDPCNYESFTCEGLVRLPITSPDEMIEVLHKGHKRCTFMETSRNCLSSRSHCLFMLTMECMENGPPGADPVVRRGKLMLVDLAGSESIKKVQAADEGNEDLRKSQAIGINRVLTSLGTVVRNMNIGLSGGHRDSALTMILHDCLGGNSRALLIANIGPELDMARETLGTLNFAQQMMSVRNMASVNTVAKDQSHILQMRGRHADIIKLLKEKAMTGQVEETAKDQAIKEEMEDINKRLLTRESAEKTLETMRDEQLSKMDELKVDMAETMAKEMDKMRRASITEFNSLKESFEGPMQKQAQEHAAHNSKIQSSLEEATKAHRTTQDEAAALKIKLASLEERAKMMQDRHEDLLMQKKNVDEERRCNNVEQAKTWERLAAAEKFKAEVEVQAAEIARLRAQRSEDNDASRKNEASWRTRESEMRSELTALRRQDDEHKRSAEIQALKRDNEQLEAATLLRLQVGKLESELTTKVSRLETDLAMRSEQHAAAVQALGKSEADTEAMQKRQETQLRSSEAEMQKLHAEIDDGKEREAELIHMLNEVHNITMSNTSLPPVVGSPTARPFYS